MRVALGAVADRRLLRHDAGAHRGGARGGGSGAPADVPLALTEREPPSRGVPHPAETLLSRKLAAGETVVSVELDPPKGATAERLIEAAKAVTAVGRASTWWTSTTTRWPAPACTR